jgi:hypothetical protein
LSFPTVLLAAAVFGPLAFNQFAGWMDFVVAGFLYIGKFSVLVSSICWSLITYSFFFCFIKKRNVPRKSGYAYVPSQDSDF